MPDANQDIFADMEAAAAQIEKENQQIDLGPISRLVDKQQMLEAKPGLDRVKKLLKLVDEIGASVADIDETVKQRKKHLFNVRQVQIPEMMRGFGLKSVTTETGTTIEIKDGLSVTVKSADRLYAFLRQKGLGDIIKDTITVAVDDEKSGKGVIESLEKLGVLFNRKEAVHGGTLKKQCKLLLEKGETVPPEVATLYQYEYSNIKNK
jgi:hypothetical protein